MCMGTVCIQVQEHGELKSIEAFAKSYTKNVNCTILNFMVGKRPVSYCETVLERTEGCCWMMMSEERVVSLDI